MDKNKISIQLDEKTLPTTRKEQFFDILKHQLGTLFSVGGLLLAFSILLFASLVVKEVLINNVVINVNMKEHPDQVYEMVKMLTLIFDAVNIVAIAFLFIGLAGAYKVIKKLIFMEKVFIFRDFKQGIKENWGQFLIISFFFSIVLLIFDLFSVQSGNMSNEMTTVAWVLMGIFSFTIFPIFLLSMSSIATYKNKFSDNLKNSFYICAKHYLYCLIFAVIFAAIWIGLFFLYVYANSSVIYTGVIAFIIFILLPLYLLASFLFNFSLFDLHINSNYPEIYNKGIR